MIIKKIELGSFNRDEDNPIMLKEKIERDGSSSLRIYQRKDIDSITSFKDKVKTMMKYGIEDFCMKHEILRPLLQNIGINRIERLNTDDHDATLESLQSIRSCARIGLLTVDNENKLKAILGNHELSVDSSIDLHTSKNKDNDFFLDLWQFIEATKPKEEETSDWQFEFHEDFTSKHILTKKQIDDYQTSIRTWTDRLETLHDNYSMLRERAPDGFVNTSDNHFSGGSIDYLLNLKDELEKKMDEIKQRSTNPTDADIKTHLLSLFEKLPVYGDKARHDEKKKEASEMRSAINTLFSNSWWISKERKMESLKKINDHFEWVRPPLPEAVLNRLHREQESVSVSPLSDPHRRTIDDDTTLESPGKIQHFSENNQGLRSGAVTHGIYTDRKLKTSSSTSDPQRKTTEDDD